MIGNKVSRSALFMVAAQGLAKGLDFIAVLIVARFLTPEDFGLVALASSVMLIANSLTEVPVAEALIRGETISEDDLGSAFTLTLLRGIGIAAILWLVAEPIAYWLDDPRLAEVIRVLAIGPLIQGLASPGIAHSLKSVNFRLLALSQMAGKVAAFAAIVIGAIVLQSYWALVAGLVVNPVVAGLSTHVLAPWRPRLRLNRIGVIFAFSGWITLSRMVFTLNMQMDRFFVGAILGKAKLGQYSMAGDLSSMVTYTLAQPIMQPLFAGFSTMHDDRDHLRQAYLRGQQILFTVIAPIGFLFAVLSSRFIPLALGEAWRPMVPLIWWLAPVISLQMLTIPTQSLVMAMGRPRLLLVRETLQLLLRLPATLAAAWFFGLVAAAAARAIASAVMILWLMGLASNLLATSVWVQLRGFARSFVALAALVGASLAADLALPTGSNVGMQLLWLSACVATGLFTYLVVLFGGWHLTGRPEGAESWIVGKLVRRLRA